MNARPTEFTMRRFSSLFCLFALAVLFAAQPAAAIKVLAFGDSLTAGVGDENGAGYPKKLQKLLGSGNTVVNHGVPSETTTLGLSRIDSVLALGGDALVLMEGTNDVSEVADGTLSLETVVTNIDAMITKTKGAGIEPILASIVPRPPQASRDATNTLTGSYVLDLRDLAVERKLRFITTYDMLDPRLEPGTFSSYYSKDPTDRVGHLNGEGYQMLAQRIADLLNGVDTSRPVVGDFFPGTLPNVVPQNIEIVVPVYDFAESSGLNKEATELLINGAVVATGVESEGTVQKLELKHKGQKALGCRSVVQLRAEDRAEPPNQIDRVLAVYGVEGRRVIPGDVDFDCRVDGVDLVSFALRFGLDGTDPNYFLVFDLNRDGVIDGNDLAILASNFGKSSR